MTRYQIELRKLVVASEHKIVLLHYDIRHLLKSHYPWRVQLCLLISMAKKQEPRKLKFT